MVIIAPLMAVMTGQGTGDLAGRNSIMNIVLDGTMYPLVIMIQLLVGG